MVNPVTKQILETHDLELKLQHDPKRPDLPTDPPKVGGLKLHLTC